MNTTRPLGVTVLCVLVAISLGFIPILVGYTVMQSPEVSGILGLDSFTFVLSAALAVGIIISAFFTWKGDTKAKKILIALVWVHVIGVVLNNVYFLVNPDLLGVASRNDQFMTKVLMNIGRAVFWLVLMYWYFNTQKAKEYFQG